MKLNYKRTILVGFAFFLICLFWQAYDNTIPLILTNKFGMSQTWSGVIMALDNILALFLLPVFGALSDKVKTKSGRRTPFIMIGTILAAVLFVGLSITDAKQLTRVESVSPQQYESSLAVIYDADPVISVPEAEKDGLKLGEAIRRVFSENKKQRLQELKTRDEFLAIKM
ncbi:MAG: MFS transporter [Clostridia bacterium]|nr:MFS transporter [Clostridia bacterium]